jgi:hypothetical protein
VAISPTGAVAVPLTVYGSWVTKVAPESVPENVSPDCGDVAFAPGQVGSRPCLDIVLGAPFPAGGANGLIPTVVYGKSFKLPTGVIQNLYFDSNGNFWVENLTTSPGTYTLLFTSTAGSTCKSITQFGREYIAISDGLHGTEVPLQWDGTLLRRYTSDGPGAPAVVANLAIASSQMAASGNTMTRLNNEVTCNTATPHNLKVGYQAQISNVPDSNATTVNQEKTSQAQNTNGSGNWSEVNGEWRSNFNPGTSQLSNLVFQAFGFTIPSTATILGIEVNVGLASQSSPTSGYVSQVALWSGSGTLGTIKTPGTAFTDSIVVASYGSAGDSWGATLTPSVVNDPSFGFAIACVADNIRLFITQPWTITVYYTLSGSGTVSIISSIVINNETQPGLALVTTTEPHGLVPGISVSIVGVEPGAVADITAAQWSAGTTTVTTATNHNLTPGSVVQIGSVSTSTSGTAFSFNGTFTVDTVPSPNQITYKQTPITATDPDVINATASSGAITVAWPIPDDTPTPTYFNVESAPSPTTFYVAVDYADGTWSTGTVGFAWEGIFYVTAVITPTQFQYLQYGPDGSTTAVGTVTPFGQAAPGLHLMQVLWITDEGLVTAPSPPVTFIANGGQYIAVSQIPIGPSYVKGRILQFTGAQPLVPGELPPFFYIPTTPQSEGQIVGTATQINDNTTTSVVLDFSDNTLYAAIGTSIPGNTLANQIVLDGALGFGAYQSRLFTWGQRNVVDNLLNMGFGGGSFPLTPTHPLGWTVVSSGGTLTDGRFGGNAWQIDSGIGSGELSQSFYQDAYGAPIAESSITYAFRCYIAATGSGTLIATISSASTGFSATATIAYTGSGWYQATFTAETPDAIPTDMMFSIQGFAGLFTISELSLFDSQNQYTDTEAYASYFNNPEGIDGVTGQFGPADDPSKVMDFGILRDTLYILTQAPSGRLHETTGSGVTEPSGWQVNEVSSDCGILSAISLTHSQADDTTASGGDDWLAWPTEGGAVIFGGGMPEKISEEIQPNWYDPTQTNTAIQINMAAALTAWGLNDPVQRLLMFGLPIGTATAPSKVYVLNYQNLNSASSIAGSPPFHPSFAGKLIATDNSRKWAPWNMTVNGAVRMYRAPGAALTLVMLGGNGQAYGEAAGFGNIYTLSPALKTDDDYGQVSPYYTTYAFLDPEKAQQLQLAGGRILLAYLRAHIAYTGQVTASYYPDSLLNLWPLTTTRSVSPAAFFDQEFGGGQCTGDRIFIKIASSPLAGQTDNGFLMTRLTAYIKNAKMQIRGSAY